MEEEQLLLMQERDGGCRVQLNSRDDESSYSSSRRSSLSELMMSSRNSCGSGEYHHGLNTKNAARIMEGDRRRPPAARRCLSEEYDMKRHVDQAVEIFPAHDKLGRLLENPTPQSMGKLSTKTKISYPCKKNSLSNNRPVQKQAAQIRSAAAKEGWISRWNAAPCVRRSSSSSRRDLPMSTTSIAWHRHKQLGEKELPHSSSSSGSGSSRATTVAGSMPSLFNKKEACALAPEEANALSSSSSSYGLALRSKYSRHAADAAHGDAANTRQQQRRSERGIDDSEQRRRGANDSSFFCDSSSSSSRSQDDDFSTKWEQEIVALQTMIARTSTLLARGSNSKPTTGDGDRQQLRISGRGFSKETATSELMMAGTKVGDQEEPENNLSSFSRRLQQQGFESEAAADGQSSCTLLASSTLPKQGPDATGEETEISSRDQIGLWESEPSTPSSSDRQYFSPAGSQQEIEEVEVRDDDDDDDEHELHLEDESLAAPCSKEDEEDDDKSFSSIRTVRTLETGGSSSASSNDFPAERFNLRFANCIQLNYRNSCREEEDTAVVEEADYDYDHDHDHDLDDAAVPGDWEVVEMSRDVDPRITSAHSSCRYYNSRYLEPEDLQDYSDTSRTMNDSDDDLSMEEHDEHNQHWHLRGKHINLMNPMYCSQLAESFGVPASSTQLTTRDFATKELAETVEAAARFKWEEEEEEAHDRLKLDDDDYNMVVIRRRTANVKIHNSSTATTISSATNLRVQQQQQQQPQAQHSFSMFESAWAESCSSMAQDDDISFATPSNTSSFHGNKSSSENNLKPVPQHSSQTDCNNRLTNTTTTTMTISLNGSSSISSQRHIKGCLDEAGSNSCKEEKGSPTNSCSSSSSTSPICEHEFPCMMCELANNVHAAATTKSCCNNLKFFTPQQQQLHLGECSAAEETLDHQSCNHSDIIKKQMWHLRDHVHLYPGWHQTPPQQQQHHCTTPQNFFGSEHPTTLHGAPSVVLRKMLMSPNYYYSDSGGAIFITTHNSQIKFLVKTVCKLFKRTLTRCRVRQCWDCSPACNKDNKDNNFAGQQLEALSS
ncbi:unnamed protein product [Sphagnum jensenii]|uniref:Uncharacterized protein n=1 Tax=Sphagnum jensenii TaxID=128206 RepID=A0ABP0X9S0_9BRYO